MPPTLDSSEFGIAFHGASSVEHKRFTQHNFKALSNTVKSVMFRPPYSLHFIMVDLFYFRLLILPNELKNYFVDLFRKAMLFRIALPNSNSLLSIENERNKDNFDDVLSKMLFL